VEEAKRGKRTENEREEKREGKREKGK